MRNTLEDLNNHLFAQLERLGEEDLTSEKLQEEIERAKSITDVATQIIATGSLALKAETFIQEYGLTSKANRKMPPMLKSKFTE